MRTLQVRAVCNRCEKVEFYDMPVKIDYENKVVCDPGSSNFTGPPGWKMFLRECYCSTECQDYVKIKTEPPLFKFKITDEARHDWKEWQEYCKVKDSY